MNRVYVYIQLSTTARAIFGLSVSRVNGILIYRSIAVVLSTPGYKEITMLAKRACSSILFAHITRRKFDDQRKNDAEMARAPFLNDQVLRVGTFSVFVNKVVR